MNSQTKLMIVTSDEDLIRRLVLNKTPNTRIIDLDDNSSNTSVIEDNGNVIDLSFLAQLSESSPNRDLVYKRVLDTPQRTQTKATKVFKKANDLVCVVCGDHAIGFNYDAVTCASCKAFFRRNALQPPEQMHCLEGKGKCSVSHGTRRKCQLCRLNRCFAMGMRKEYFLSEEDKQRRQKRINDNRRGSTEPLPPSPPITESLSPAPDQIDLVLMGMDNDDLSVPFSESIHSNEIEKTTLSVQDWLAIQSVQSSYLLAFQHSSAPCTSDVSDLLSALVCWSQIENEASLKLIGFFRQIDQFEALNADDRFTLIKYNLLPLFVVRKSLQYNPITGLCSDIQNGEVDRGCRFDTFCHEAKEMREMFMELMRSLVNVTEQDATLLRLLLVVLLFSKGLSMSIDEPQLTDPSAVHRAQSHYTRLIWNYLVDKQGEESTVRQFGQLLAVILRIQFATRLFREYLRARLGSPDTVDRITPLMQAVLQIS